MLALTPAVINAFHLVFSAPLFLYLAYYQNKANSAVLNSLKYIALGGAAYHLYRLYQGVVVNRTFGWLQYANIFHALFLFPLLWWVGDQDGVMSEGVSRALGGLGLLALVYHGYSLARRLNLL